MPLSKLSNLVSSASTGDDGSSSAADVDISKAAGSDPAYTSTPAPAGSDSRSHRRAAVGLRKSKPRTRGSINWCAEPGVTTNGTASSCQLFSMFKAMATDKGGDDASTLSVDTDSEAPSGDDSEVEPAMAMGESPPITNGHTDTDWFTAPQRAAGDRFAAASLNAFSPIAGDSDLHDSKLEINTQGLSDLHMDDSSVPYAESPLSASATDESSSIPSTPATSARQTSLDEDPRKLDKTHRFPDRLKEIARFRHDDVPEEEKMSVIVGEFGEIADKMVNADGTPAEAEHIIAESQGTLFKGVMMLGNLHLTNYRLLFHALLPPDSAFVSGSPEPDQTEEQANARFARPDIMKSGNVTVHREGLMKSKKKVWMELSPDMLTTYPAGDEAGRVRPLYSILLSHALRLAPFEPSRAKDFFFTYDTPGGQRTLHFSVDNEQSANQWRRLLEGALFRQARQKFRRSHAMKSVQDGLLDPSALDDAADGERWSMVRCCVPLDRAELEGTADYHSFATLIKLAIRLDTNQHLSWHPEHLAEGNYDSYGKRADEVKSPVPSTPARSKTEGEAPSKRVSLSLIPKLRLGRSDSRSSSPRPSRESSVERPRRSCDSADPHWMDLNRSQSEPTDPSTPASPGYMDASLRAAFDRECFHAHAIHREDTPWGEENTFQLLLALLNESNWFADSLGEAVEVAHTRKYKEGVEPAKMQLDVGGYDCLAADDEIEKGRDGDTASIPSLDEDEDAGKPRALIETRKAEKAAMAARVFGLRESEGIWLKRCYIDGIVPARGHIILTPRYLCFWRRANVGADIKYRFASQDVKGVEKHTPLKVGMHGLAVQIHGHHDLLFDFWKPEARNEVLQRIKELIERSRPESEPSTSEPPSAPVDPKLANVAVRRVSEGSSLVTASSSGDTPLALWENARNVKIGSDQLAMNPKLMRSEGEAIQQAAEVLAPPPDMLMYPQAMTDEALSYMPFVANRPWFSKTGWNVRLTPRKFAMLTIGSRGDVQPYIALALRLMEDGHDCVIVTHDEFKAWIESYGIEHRQAGGDPTALMKLSTEHAMFSPGFFKEALGGFRRWLDELLVDSWHACYDADVLIESPSTMSGIHIAEALGIPYFRAFTMPWTRTTAYPQAFMVPMFEMGPSFNYSTYVLFDNIIWRASSGQINRWRKKYLHLPATDQSTLSVSKVPFLYNFSPAVVPKPLDWNDDITITGYWNLENSDMEWTAPDSLLEFMAKAKADNKAIVYIGFGSIVVPDPVAMTKSIVKGVEKAGVCAIIAKGWSARGEDSKKSDHIEFSDSCYAVDKVPHSWLFPKIQAALHHGGAGTTGASLRAGLPTLIKPWFGDQYFWALRVTKLGVGLKLGGLRSDDIAAALKKATTDRIMIEKAARIGERISSESGVDTALNVINESIMRAARDRPQLKKEETVPCTEKPLYKAIKKAC